MFFFVARALQNPKMVLQNPSSMLFTLLFAMATKVLANLAFNLLMFSRTTCWNHGSRIANQLNRGLRMGCGGVPGCHDAGNGNLPRHWLGGSQKGCQQASQGKNYTEQASGKNPPSWKGGVKIRSCQVSVRLPRLQHWRRDVPWDLFSCAQVPSKKRLEETVHVRSAQEVELVGHRDRPNGNDASRSQECPDETAVQSASRPEEPSGGPRVHRLDPPVQRSDLQALDRQTARSHWRQSHQEEQCLALGNHSDWLLLHTVVQGLGPEEFGSSWARLRRSCQQVERHSECSERSLICTHLRKQSLKTSGGCFRHR